MYQNFNCCSSDWMERTKYIQGRSGTKSKDCLPFVQYYKCLEKKKKMRTFSICIYAFLFPAHVPLGISCHYSIHLPHSLPRPPNFFSLSEEFYPRRSQQSCCLSHCISPLYFLLSLLTVSCAIISIKGLGREQNHL